MTSFDVEYVGDTPGDIERRLSQISEAARGRTESGLLKTAHEVKEDLEATSPVDTGEYQGSWYVYPVQYDEVWVLNSANHARFVMLPNSRMVNSASADLPSQGILHNVKGVARGHQSGLRLNMIREFRSLFNRFRVNL